MRTFVLTMILILVLGRFGFGQTVRFATFNASLNRNAEGELVRDLSTPDNPQAKNVAEVIQRAAPDVLLINEFDYVADGSAARLFQENYLAKSQNGASAVEYPHVYVAPSNTGIHSGFDLDNDGAIDKTVGARPYGNDCFGFGVFPGQYGFVIYSKFPIGKITTMQSMLWKDFPGANLPENPDGTPWYSDEEIAVFRLSSKNHVDVAIEIRGQVVHVLASHPTPRAFDGPERRNGKRNFDEIRMWVSRIDALNEPFVLMGDMNADPNDGNSISGAAQQLLNHPKIDSTLIPESAGAEPDAKAQGGDNVNHKGSSKFDTADFNDTAPGNLRVDYVLPSKNLKPIAGGVFWPAPDDPLHRLVEMRPVVATSDHRLIWLDVEIPAKP